MESTEEHSGDNGHVDGAPEPVAMSPYDGAFAEGPDVIPLSTAKHSVTLDGDIHADGSSSEVESGVENGADAELHINGTSEKYPFPMPSVSCETSEAVDEVLPEEESQTSTDPLQVSPVKVQPLCEAAVMACTELCPSESATLPNEHLPSLPAEDAQAEASENVKQVLEESQISIDSLQGDLVSDAHAIDVGIPVIPVEAVLAQTADYLTMEATLPDGNQETEASIVLPRVPGSFQGSPTKRVLSTEKQKSPINEHSPTKRPARITTEDRSKKPRAETVATRPKPLASPKSSVPLMRSPTAPKMKEVKPKIVEKPTAKPALERHASAPVRLMKPLAKTNASRMTSKVASKASSATAAGVSETKAACSSPIKRPFGANRKENQDIHSKVPGARSKVGPSAEKCSVPPPAVSTQRPVVSHTSKPSTTCMPPRVGLASGTRVRKYGPTLPNKVSSLPGDSKAGTQAPTTVEASNARPKAKVSNDVRCPTASMKTTTLKETGDGASADVKSFVKDKPVGKILPRKVEASTARSKPTSKDKPTRSAMAMPRAAPVRTLQGNLQTRTARNASAKTTCNFNTSRVPPLGKKSETGKVRSKSMLLHKADVGTARPRVTKERVESTSALPELPKQTEEPTCTVPPENIARTAESDVSSPHEKKEEQTMNANEVADEGNPEVVIVQGENEHYSTDLASEDKSV